MKDWIEAVMFALILGVCIGIGFPVGVFLVGLVLP